MLKKFLKFLKGTSRDQDFDGSYLDHLLAEVSPRVQVHLDQCPEHDPLLLVVAEILRLTQPEQWTAELDCPLVDDQSPGLPASPPPQPAADSSSEGFEIMETSEDLDDGDESDGDADASTEDQADTEDVDDSEEAQENNEDDDSKEAQKNDENGENDEDTKENTSTQEDEAHVDDEAVAAASEAHPPEPSTLDSAELDSSPLDPAPMDTAPAAHAEIGADKLDPGALSDLESKADAAEPAETKRLDSPDVLQAGRIFLGLLIENDRLPIGMQLSISETMLARDLLLGYFAHDEQFDDKVKELLSLVEQKFNDGAFSQARILLQLFQRDRPNQINNDRNLFYEDMILRLGIRRRHLINNTLLADLKEKSSAADLDVSLTGSTDWLEENLHIKLHLFTRVPEDTAYWRKFAAQSRRSGAENVFLRYIPPKRWRPLANASRLPSERVLAHVSPATVKRYIVRQIKTCYFVLRAVGDTGLEPFIDDFFTWSESKFGFNSVRMMPLVYRQTMSETQLIDKIFEGAFRRFFQKDAAKFVSEFDDETILEATRATLDDLVSLDFNRIPPGDYDLGGFIFDRLLDLEYHEPEFAFKIHRLS
jgi:hypothetical protein